ncbi:MAG: SET domain-containing protein-lysine N-methyltransferase [Nanoarchaeota archaeon]|nr:SET domain-containing protein-lysine N-methyltransferase [Nanoarchaeota archaeon]
MVKSIKVDKAYPLDRGVFALEDIKTGDIIEECPLLMLGLEDRILIKATILDNYYFELSDGRAAIPGGCGMFYNHSYTPNANYAAFLEKRLMIVEAIKPIKSGEEIRINYKGDPNSRMPLWFAVID